MYIKLSTSPNFPVSAFYYIIIFIGFHLFEDTVTTRFLQRTKIIFTGYLKSSEYVKAFLWVFLVFIPSFMKHPVPLFMVCQPLMLHAYLFHFDYILCGLSMLYFWCILLGLANRFGIGISFLRKCSNYFARRACLHYIGNTFGKMFGNVLKSFNPGRVVFGLGFTLGGWVVPVLEDKIATLDKEGLKAAKAAQEKYITELGHSPSDDPQKFACHYSKLKAYNEAFKDEKRFGVDLKRLAKSLSVLKLCGLPMPEDINEAEFKKYCQDKEFAETYDSDMIAKSFEEVVADQAMCRAKLREKLKNISASGP